MTLLLRPRASLSLVLPSTCLCRVNLRNGALSDIAASRQYATQSSLGGNPKNSSGRRQVTIASDDGRINWNELSTREKAARTTQQSFNLFVILAGVIMTGGVATYLYLDVFSGSSKTAHFNRTVSRIISDPQCLEVLGDRKSIRAYGEPTWNRWTRNRAIASKLERDKIGTDHFHMHFYVEGSLNKGTVNLHMSKRADEAEWKYEVLALDVPGRERIYLEKAATAQDLKGSGKMFGVRWW
ncbi:TIM21-domain-containing protein [Rhizodiscina lignyota]|uniref:Mitochondrial import inner membrane translocase subunit Tim21 n=1 Tax=Rhizodiscina lignyota TaxID=1504668 RepID=A0A9P4IF04_9PEZI|nr:TIM21-domain-containing protein [Rhizodiscina lignyota]